MGLKPRPAPFNFPMKQPTKYTLQRDTRVALRINLALLCLGFAIVGACAVWAIAHR